MNRPGTLYRFYGTVRTNRGKEVFVEAFEMLVETEEMPKEEYIWKRKYKHKLLTKKEEIRTIQTRTENIEDDSIWGSCYERIDIDNE